MLLLKRDIISRTVDLELGLKKAFDTRFHTHYKSLLWFASTFIDNRSDVEDIVQDAFIRLWEKREKFSNELQVKSFLYKTVQFRCIDKLRGRGQQPSVGFDEEKEEAILHHIIRSETWQQVCSAIDNLPPVIGKVIRLIYTEGKSIKETAELLGKSVSTVKEQRRRGIELLRAKGSDWMLIFILLHFIIVNH